MKRFIPIGILFAVFLAVIIPNFHPNTFLMGWDNLLPELNLLANIKQSIFSVWAQQQGLGAISANEYLADLPHQLLLALISPIFPLAWLRQIYTFLMLFIGMFGMYFLLLFLFATKKRNSFKIQATSILGALFYLCNLATIQAFYVPYETFTTHFAFLPWIFFAVLLYLHQPRRKYLVLLSIVSLLFLPQSYVPTLFITILIAIVLISGVFYITHCNKKTLKHIFFVFLILFVTNVFWLLPFAYFTIQNSAVVYNAKLNQTVTQTIFAQNKEFGNIWDTVLLRGFWFNNIDPNLQGQFTYMMMPWKAFFHNPLPWVLGFIFFGILLLGFVITFKNRNTRFFPFVGLFLFSILILTTNTPPFSWINTLFRDLPFFEEVFRFPFTKFSLLAAATYSIFFAYGIYILTHYISNKKYWKEIVSILIGILLLLYVFPAFQGHFFYNKEHLTIPQDYFQTFNFFRHQDQNTRIADFPEYSFYGWTYYRWGYGGSGFLWHGITQPILDPAYDVWSTADENYYWESTRALYSDDPKQLQNIFNKYQITWLLIDKNVYNPDNPSTINFQQFQSLLSRIPSVKEVKQFGNISIYKVSLQTPQKNFLIRATTLPTINRYAWGDTDVAFAERGFYQSENQNQYIYPFRSLFSGKNQENLSFQAEQLFDSVSISTKINSPLNTQSSLTIPSLLDAEKIIPIKIIAKHVSQQTLQISYSIETPSIIVGNKTVWHHTVTKFLGNFSTPYETTHIDINGLSHFDIPSNADSTQQTFFLTDQDNVITVTSDRITNTFMVSKQNLEKISFLNETRLPMPSKDTSVITVLYPKIITDLTSFTINPTTHTKAVSCDAFRKGSVQLQTIQEDLLQVTSTNATNCLTFSERALSNSFSYLIFADSQNLENRSSHFWINNDVEKFAPIDTYFPPTDQLTSSIFVLPPMEKFGNGYTIHLDNISIGNDPTQNRIGPIVGYEIPYSFLTHMKIVQDNTLSDMSFHTLPMTTIYAQSDSYTITVPKTSSASTIILSQGYDRGWQMYPVDKNIPLFFTETMPFLFSRPVATHMVVNNWQNGWNLGANSQPQTYLIVFLPQYLEYCGIILLFLGLPCLLLLLKE